MYDMYVEFYCMGFINVVFIILFWMVYGFMYENVVMKLCYVCRLYNG